MASVTTTAIRPIGVRSRRIGSALIGPPRARTGRAAKTRLPGDLARRRGAGQAAGHQGPATRARPARKRIRCAGSEGSSVGGVRPASAARRSARGQPARAPATTMVTSPRAPDLAVGGRAASSAERPAHAPPRGAWSAPGRPRPRRSAPQAAARSRSVAAVRPGASNRTRRPVVRGDPREPLAALAARSAAGTPRTPSAAPAMPLADERGQHRRRARDRHDPRRRAAAQAATSPSPGSLTSGVPASVTSATSRAAGEARQQLRSRAPARSARGS